MADAATVPLWTLWALLLCNLIAFGIGAVLGAAAVERAAQRREGEG